MMQPQEQQDGAFVLKALKEPQITLLKGLDGHDTFWSQLLQGAEWLFTPAQTFALRPGPRSPASGAFPSLKGMYKRSNNILEFAGEPSGEPGASIAFDGIFHLDGPVVHLDMICALASPQPQIARITQELGYASQPLLPAQSGRIINGISIPSTFRITLSGQIDNRQFGSGPATIEISECAVGDPNPFAFLLTSDVVNAFGSLYWNSFTSGKPGWSWLECKISLPAHGQALLTIVGDQVTRPSWYTLTQGHIAGGLLISVDGNTGSLTFAVGNDRITGEVRATGVSALGQPGSYSASFTGKASRVV